MYISSLPNTVEGINLSAICSVQFLCLSLGCLKLFGCHCHEKLQGCSRTDVASSGNREMSKLQPVCTVLCPLLVFTVKVTVGRYRIVSAVGLSWQIILSASWTMQLFKLAFFSLLCTCNFHAFFEVMYRNNSLDSPTWHKVRSWKKYLLTGSWFYAALKGNKWWDGVGKTKVI